MIPPRIHDCRFGDGRRGDLSQKCAAGRRRVVRLEEFRHGEIIPRHRLWLQHPPVLRAVKLYFQKFGGRAYLKRKNYVPGYSDEATNLILKRAYVTR